MSNEEVRTMIIIFLLGLTTGLMFLYFLKSKKVFDLEKELLKRSNRLQQESELNNVTITTNRALEARIYELTQELNTRNQGVTYLAQYQAIMHVTTVVNNYAQSRKKPTDFTYRGLVDHLARLKVQYFNQYQLAKKLGKA